MDNRRESSSPGTWKATVPRRNTTTLPLEVKALASRVSRTMGCVRPNCDRKSLIAVRSVELAGNLIPGKHATGAAETVTSPKSSYESWPSAPAALAHAENRLRLQ